MYPHGYIGMTTDPKLTDWSDNQSLDEFDDDDDEEQDDTTNADGGVECPKCGSGDTEERENLGKVHQHCNACSYGFTGGGPA